MGIRFNWEKENLVYILLIYKGELLARLFFFDFCFLIILLYSKILSYPVQLNFPSTLKSVNFEIFRKFLVVNF